MAGDATKPGAAIDPYRELGVARGADQRTIRAAYHARARARHPDMGGDAGAMARINAAYDLLRDARRRADFETREASRAGDSAAHGHARGWGGGAKVPPWTGSAGSPPGRPSGPVLDFGIFAGWSLGEIARRDPGYLVWLADQREGKVYLEKIEEIIAPMREAARVQRSPTLRKGRFRR